MMYRTKKDCMGTAFSTGASASKLANAAIVKDTRSCKLMFTDRRYMSTSSWNKNKSLNFGRRKEKKLGSSLQGGESPPRHDKSYLEHFTDAVLESFEEDMKSKKSILAKGILGEEAMAAWGRRRRKRTRRRRFGGGLMSKVKRGIKKVKGGLKKLKGGFKKMLGNKLEKIFIKVVGKYIRKLMGFSKAKFACICTVFVKPYVPSGTAIAISPSFTRRDQKPWLTQEPVRAQLFSILKIRTKGHASKPGANGDTGRYGAKSNQAICKFDAAVSLLECRNHKEYRSGCNKRYAPGAKLLLGGSTCSTTFRDRAIWHKGYQCKPNKASCEGGSMVKRDIAVKLDPLHKGTKTDECQRLLLPLDAMVRWAIGPIAALNTEGSQRAACGHPRL